jgi:hypothetical protein
MNRHLKPREHTFTNAFLAVNESEEDNTSNDSFGAEMQPDTLNGHNDRNVKM